VSRETILAEIKRIALENGGRAPGRDLFERETSIKMTEWYPHLWLRWGDPLSEAGYAPNSLQGKLDDQAVIESYISLVRELGRIPVEGEIRRKARGDQTFPSHTVFGRFGGKEKLLDAIVAHCRRTDGFEDVLALCAERQVSAHSPARNSPQPKIATAFVYLMKSGKHYKIGHTNRLAGAGVSSR
jgi:hypothetical protein